MNDKPTQVIVVENNPVHFETRVNTLLKDGYVIIPETLLVDDMKEEREENTTRTLFQYLVVVALPRQS